MALAPGTRLGPYDITGQLGAGGMGEVYKARDTRLDRTVAIQVMPADLAPDGQKLVYSGVAPDGTIRLWLHRLDVPSPQPLAGTEDGQYPFWSPDRHRTNQAAR